MNMPYKDNICSTVTASLNEKIQDAVTLCAFGIATKRLTRYKS